MCQCVQASHPLLTQLQDQVDIPMLLPKFHCEINPIERCWAQAKRYVRAHTNYTLGGLRQNVPQGLDYVTVENIRNHFRKIRHYMFGYLLGVSAGPELEEHVKKCKKIYSSHRRKRINMDYTFSKHALNKLPCIFVPI